MARRVALVTGGAGYIGSHTCLELLAADYDIVVVDNLSNSCAESLARVRRLAGLPAADDAPGQRLRFVEITLLDRDALDRVFAAHAFDVVVHFAAFKAVGESMQQPLMYYRNNLVSHVNLVDLAIQHGVRRFVFSSSCTVYGVATEMPLTEASPTGAINPYGRTKDMAEHILRDVAAAHRDFQVVILRYFNPTGAHESGEIGEDPLGIPNCLMPYVQQVAVGRREKLSIFGNDYPTRDGTCLRDYIHVVDLAAGHVAALKRLDKESSGCVLTYNLGTGNGISVLEMVHAFEAACGSKIPFEFAPRRAGDAAEAYADPKRAEAELGWKATRGIKEMCEDNWRWISKNPSGYKTA